MRMNRRRFLALSLAALARAGAAPLAAAAGRVAAESPIRGAVPSAAAVDLVMSSRVVDMLGLMTLDWPKLRRWQRHPQTFSDLEARRLAATGIDVFHPAVETNSPEARAAAVKWMNRWNRLLSGQPCRLGRVDGLHQLQTLPEQGRIGVIIGFQNSTHFESIGDVDTFWRLGQRVSQLTYNEANRLGSGCQSPQDQGLTDYGAEIVAAMNRVGIAVDVSHCGEQTTLDAIAASSKPVLVTHSNCRALAPAQRRCKSDEVLRKLAGAGGVIGITVVRAFVNGRRPSLETLLDHFDHAIRVAGVEHVGLGTDVASDAIEHRTGLPISFYRIDGLDLEHRVAQITDGLLRRGHSERDVRLVLGGNFIRALGAIWPEDRAQPGPIPPTLRDPFCPPLDGS